MRFIKNPAVVGALCFVLGASSLYLVQKLRWIQGATHPERSSALSVRDMDSFLDDSFGENFFSRSQDPFEQMRAMRKNMLKHFNFNESGEGGHLFDSWYSRKFGGSTVGDVNKREDDQYVYYDIAVKGLKQEKVNVRVENGQITISGQVENKTEDEGSASYTSSTFHRSFPAPDGVDSNKVQMVQEKDKLVVKFPKIKT